VEDRRLLVDLSAPAVLSDDEVRGWAADQRVFISSVMAGMQPERAAVAAAVARAGAEPVWFERFGGRDDNAELAYLSEVAACDVYVGILGQRYGTPAATTGYSATHAEYVAAVERGLRTSVWVHDGPLDGPQQDFVSAVQVFRTTGRYTSPEDLADGVTSRLRAMAAEELSPWVKLDHVVFRARRVVDDGSRLVVEARVRDDAVLAALEGMRPDGTWRTTQDVAATWRGRTTSVRLDTVRTETTSGRGGVVTIEARRVERSGTSTMTDIAYSGYSPDDLTELALRVALFGEPTPLREMSFLARIDNPFEEMDGLRLPADAVEPVAGLLLTESLVGSGRAERITHLDVGPAHLGRRQIALGWVPRRRYSNVTPEPRHIEGDVTARRTT
jgi:hypothetical protein